LVIDLFEFYFRLISKICIIAMATIARCVAENNSLGHAGISIRRDHFGI
jgi:hypothetical protein